MGSEYTLHKDNEAAVSICEGSNLLQLCITDHSNKSAYYNYYETEELAPIEMLKLLMKGITATSYFLSEKEFKEEFSKLETYEVKTDG